jgi:hypothetical protein
VGELIFVAAWVYALWAHWPPVWLRDLLLLAPIGVTIWAIFHPKAWPGHPFAQAVSAIIVGCGFAGAPAGLEAFRYAHFQNGWTPLLIAAAFAIPAYALARLLFLTFPPPKPPTIRPRVPVPSWIRWGMPLASIACVAGYVFAALVAVDQRPDHTAARVVRTQVLDKEHFVNKTGIGHEAKLASWGWTSVDPTVEVGPAVYAQLVAGGKACITLHPGYLGWAWFEVAACGPDSRPAE